jgi:hypothetical protein
MALSRKYLSLLFPFLWSSLLLSQSTPTPPRLIQLTRKSGYMFSGTVLKVQRIGTNKNSGADSVAVTFHVDKGLRGIKTGQTLTIREWAGLWNSQERYRPGEHAFLFLYPPSRLGLTSPVNADSGRLNIDSNNRVILPGSLPDEMPVSSRVRQPAKKNHTLALREFAAAIRRASEE